MAFARWVTEVITFLVELQINSKLVGDHFVHPFAEQGSLAWVQLPPSGCNRHHRDDIASFRQGISLKLYSPLLNGLQGRSKV